MRGLTTFAGALGVALLMSTGAFAQVPPDPNNPNDAPAPDKYNYLPYGEDIKVDAAKKVAAAAVEEANKHGWPMCITVADTHGELVYFEKMNDCQHASIAISQHKARTAARYRRATLVLERLLAKGPHFSYLTTLDDVIITRGGNPLVVGGKIVGAVGVSGGTGSQDDVTSLAGAGALK